MSNVDGRFHARRYVAAWFILVMATVFSVEVLRQSSARVLASAAVLALAAAKTAIIGLEFMELRRAPAWLRHVFLGWALAIAVALITLLAA